VEALIQLVFDDAIQREVTAQVTHGADPINDPKKIRDFNSRE
jgi:hypothetical protein